MVGYDCSNSHWGRVQRQNIKRNFWFSLPQSWTSDGTKGHFFRYVCPRAIARSGCSAEAGDSVRILKRSSHIRRGTTVWRCVTEFYATVNELLLTHLVRFPDEAKMAEMAQYFEQRWRYHTALEPLMGHTYKFRLHSSLRVHFNRRGWHSIASLALFTCVCACVCVKTGAKVSFKSSLWAILSLRFSIFKPVLSPNFLASDPINIKLFHVHLMYISQIFF